MRNFLSDSPRNKTLAGPDGFEGADKPRRSRPSVSQVDRLQAACLRTDQAAGRIHRPG